MSISRILRSGLAEAERSGARQVELQHLPEGGADELADKTLAFLRGRPGRPSSRGGWTAVSASRAGVVAWWAAEAGLATESQRRRLRTLRHQTYDLLDERGLIAKPVSPSGVVDVSPAPVTTAEAATQAEAPKPSPAAEQAKAPKAPKAPKARKPSTVAKPAKKAKKAKPAKAAKAAPSAAESTAPGAAVESEPVGAWVLRLDPTVWSLARFVADGNHEVRAWAVEDNERSAAMTRGQRVFLWAGGDETLVPAGVWGSGWVVGPCQWTSVADGYWTDPAANSQQMLFADVSIELLPHPVGRQKLVDDPRLAAAEVLRDPFGSSPSLLTPEEAAAMLELVGPAASVVPA
jgi:hypothetical protein